MSNFRAALAAQGISFTVVIVCPFDGPMQHVVVVATR